MALCINQSGTYRNITTLCINQSGTYRNIVTGCINQAGTYRCFGFTPLAVGASYEGGFLICMASPIRWVVSPRSAEISSNWHSRNNANTCAQQVSGCSGWFVPTKLQLQDPGYLCRSFWGPSPCLSATAYWSSTQKDAFYACQVAVVNNSSSHNHKSTIFCVRAFRCVTY